MCIRDSTSSAANTIQVYQNLNRGYPITLYEKGPNGEYKIELSATDTYWAQYAYQFSHEYCHVRTNYEEAKSKTMWFEEVIGEVCSLYTLQKMSDAWAVNPPYEGWRSFSSKLADYRNDIVSRQAHQLPAGVTFKSWLRTTLPELEKNPQLRGKNTIIAIELLPLFESNALTWQTLLYWNQWPATDDIDIWEAFEMWHQALPTKIKPAARELINVLEN